MKVILKIKLCVMLSLLLFMTQASFSTVYSDDSKPSDTSTSVPDSGSIRIDEKTFADTLKNFNEKIQKDPKAEKSIRKLFGKIYFRYCLEFYVKNAKNKSIDINTTEFDQAKKFAGSNLPDKPFRSAINIQGWKVVRQWLKEDSTNSLINVENKHNISSLSFAALSGNLKIVKDLIAKGADVKSKDDLGNMPLSFAVFGGSLEVVKYLIEEKGADINAKNNDGDTPLNFATFGGFLEVVKYLIEEKGLNVNAKDKSGRTPLHYAALGGSFEVAKYLIEKGADVNAKDKSGRTPLHYAALSGSFEVAKYLLEKGADVNAKDNNGKTPLHYTAF